MFFTKAVDGLELVLVDLPGYGFAQRSKHEKKQWGTLIEGYLSKRVTLRAMVLLLDVRRGADAEERELLDFVRAIEPTAARPALASILVATKIDKLSLAARKPAVAKVSKELGAPIIGFSAESGEGRDALWTAIRRAVAGRGA
jgi:GTP-binding protein